MELRYLDVEIMIVDKAGIEPYKKFVKSVETGDALYVKSIVEVLINDLRTVPSFSEQELQGLRFAMGNGKRKPIVRERTLRGLELTYEDLHSGHMQEIDVTWVSELVYYYYCGYLNGKFWYLRPTYNFRTDFVQYCQARSSVVQNLVSDAEAFDSYQFPMNEDPEVYSHYVMNISQLEQLYEIDFSEFLDGNPDFGSELAMIKKFLGLAPDQVDVVLIYAWD
jgi:hypothetical protein